MCRPEWTAEQEEITAEQALLDQFASAALTGFLASYALPETRMPSPQAAAQECYDYASAMMRERALRNSLGEKSPAPQREKS